MKGNGNLLIVVKTGKKLIDRLLKALQESARLAEKRSGTPAGAVFVLRTRRTPPVVH